MGHRKRDFDGRTKTHDDEQSMDGQDQFSNLPEPLIIEILSLLKFEDAVKTSSLAKTWKYRWTNVYNIVLRRDVQNVDKELTAQQQLDKRELDDKQWVSSVSRTFRKWAALDVNRFSLITHCSLSSVIRKWILYAIDRNVKVLEVSNYCKAPHCLFHSSSITKMELCDIKFSQLSSVSLSSLKSLRLESPETNDASLDKLLAGCPVLEDLVLENVLGIYHINIMSPNVKRFELDGFEDERDIHFLTIKAPWLQELELSGRFVTTQCQLVDVSSLMKATLAIHTTIPAVDELDTDYEEEYNNELTQYSYRWIPMAEALMNSLSYVAELTIGAELIQVLSVFKLLGTLKPLFKCKHLSIKTYLWKFDLPGIACLLENAPNLETLTISVVPFWQDMYPLVQVEELFQDEDPHLSMPNGKFMHLKNVKVDYSRYSCRDSTESNRGECFDFELVEYILRSAIVLEKLVLCSSSRSCYYSSCQLPTCTFQYLPCLSSRLLSTFLSGNEAAAEWELRKSKDKFVFSFSNFASLRPTADSSSDSP